MYPPSTSGDLPYSPAGMVECARMAPARTTDDPFSRNPLFLSLRAAARRLGIGVQQLKRARDARELPSYQLAGASRVRTDHLRAWLERHRRPVLGANEERE
jgi:hypothetical protein